MSLSSEQLVVATNAADAEAINSLRSDLAELTGAITALNASFVAGAETAVSGGGVEDVSRARLDFVEFATTDILMRSRAEEATIYRAAITSPTTRALVEGLVAEHRMLESLIQEVRESSSPVRATAAARAFVALVTVHHEKDSEVLAPALAAAADVDFAEELQELARKQEELNAPSSGGGCGGNCGCGKQQSAPEPELDATTIPREIRHATIFGALNSLKSGGSLVLSADHAPVPLLNQLEERSPGEFATEWVEEGPDVWKVRFTRN